MIADHYSVKAGMIFVCLWTIFGVIFGAMAWIITLCYQRRRDREIAAEEAAKTDDEGDTRGTEEQAVEVSLARHEAAAHNRSSE